jgi:hypothetical protein
LIGGMKDTRPTNNSFTVVMSIYLKHLPADTALFCDSVPVGRIARIVG